MGLQGTIGEWHLGVGERAQTTSESPSQRWCGLSHGVEDRGRALLCEGRAGALLLQPITARARSHCLPCCGFALCLGNQLPFSRRALSPTFVLSVPPSFSGPGVFQQCHWQGGGGPVVRAGDSCFLYHSFAGLCFPQWAVLGAELQKICPSV